MQTESRRSHENEDGAFENFSVLHHIEINVADIACRATLSKRSGLGLRSSVGTGGGMRERCVEVECVDNSIRPQVPEVTPSEFGRFYQISD